MSTDGSLRLFRMSALKRECAPSCLRPTTENERFLLFVSAQHPLRIALAFRLSFSFSVFFCGPTLVLSFSLPPLSIYREFAAGDGSFEGRYWTW